MQGDDYEKSAGCIIFREDPDPNVGTCVLILRTYAKFDLPKGHIEKKDKTPFNTAVRETFEECGFTVIDDPDIELDPKAPVARILRGGSKAIECMNINSKTGVIKKVVYLYPAETLCSTVSLLPNSKTGVLEHQGHRWEPVSSISTSGLHRYLINGVIEAHTIYRAHKAVNEALQKFR
jgi:8-oxo-dGTP pyrophosphatase MutT (NUDIX family)